MKIIYTILFFADTLLLFALGYIFLKLIDEGISKYTFALMLSAMVTSLWLMVYFLVRYIKFPDSNNNS